MKYLRLLYDPDDDKYLWSIFFVSLARDHIIKVLRSTGKVPKGCSAGMNQKIKMLTGISFISHLGCGRTSKPGVYNIIIYIIYIYYMCWTSFPDFPGK